MKNDELIATAKKLLVSGKGIIAMDESTPSCNKRFEKLGIPQTEEMRNRYRELILTTPNLADSISGTILVDETIRHTPFVKLITDKGMIPGIKVDKGAKPLALFPDETVTEGLDGLRDRLKEYSDMGARFAKWRAVIAIGKGIPTNGCIRVNAHALARYAALCQEAGLVPIVEPEVLMDGDHTLERCFEVTEKTLRKVFKELVKQRVLLEGMILKPNMVVAGKDCPQQPSVQEVAEAALTCLLRTVPAAVPGIAFLSGGQPAELATERLNAMNTMKAPWRITFSFSRAIQQPALDTWKGDDANRERAQSLLGKRAKLNAIASLGNYLPDMEK